MPHIPLNGRKALAVRRMTAGAFQKEEFFFITNR
jgi:hypothetical protein